MLLSLRLSTLCQQDCQSQLKIHRNRKCVFKSVHQYFVISPFKFPTLLLFSGTLVCSGNGTGSSSIYSIAMVAIPDCIDNATQTDISFQNILTLGRNRGHHHHHDRGGGTSSPPPPPPSPPLPHLVGPYGINELYVLTRCVFGFDKSLDMKNQ